MCKDAYSSELIPSRGRWYDFPAWLLFHRPVRCRMCQQRIFVFAPTSVEEVLEKTSRGRPVTFFRRLWTAYFVLFLLIGITSTTILTPQRLHSIQDLFVKQFQKPSESALSEPSSALPE